MAYVARPYRQIHRRKSRTVYVGKVPVGGDSPITVQSMTNTLTSDVKATVAQIRALEVAGADIVRVSCPDEASTVTKVPSPSTPMALEGPEASNEQRTSERMIRVFIGLFLL